MSPGGVRPRRIPPRRVAPLLALLALLGGLAASCARHPAPELVPGAAVPGLAAWRENTAAICRRLGSFEAHGTFAVTMNDARVEAAETLYFQAPDRLRLELEFPGYLWVPPASGMVLVRGESLYVAVPGLIEPWSGSRPEFIADWGWRAVLLLGVVGELDPRGPFGCDSGAGTGDGPGGLVLRDLGRKEVGAEGEAGGLFWQLTLERSTGRVVQLRFRRPGERGEGRSELRRFATRDGLVLPSVLDIRWQAEDLLIDIEQHEQRLDPPLAPNLFDPPGLDEAGEGVGG